MTYNLIIFENKYPSEYLNISTERELFEKLWDWTYIDDLWYFIEEENLSPYSFFKIKLYY